jgi:hypothetical protein
MGIIAVPELMRYSQLLTGKDFGFEDAPHSTENRYNPLLSLQQKEFYNPHTLVVYSLGNRCLDNETKPFQIFSNKIDRRGINNIKFRKIRIYQ